MSAFGTTVIVPDEGNPARSSTASRDGFSGPHSIATETVPRVSHANVTGSPGWTTAGVAVKVTTSGETPKARRLGPGPHNPKRGGYGKKQSEQQQS